MTDTARYADLVLPAATQLEQYDLKYSWGHHYISLNLPAVPPLGEAVSNVELFRRLAARMGFDDDPRFKLTDEEMAALFLDWSAPAELRKQPITRLLCSIRMTLQAVRSRTGSLLEFTTPGDPSRR